MAKSTDDQVRAVPVHDRRAHHCRRTGADRDNRDDRDDQGGHHAAGAGAQTTKLGAYAVLAPNEAAARSTMDTLRSPTLRMCLERPLAAANALIAGATPVIHGTATAGLPTPAMGDDVQADEQPDALIPGDVPG